MPSGYLTLHICTQYLSLSPHLNRPFLPFFPGSKLTHLLQEPVEERARYEGAPLTRLQVAREVS